MCRRYLGLVSLLVLLLTACARPAQLQPTPAPAPVPVTAPGPQVPTQVGLFYRYGDAWQPVTPLTSHIPAGPAEIRLSFSKPVRQAEVEQALLASQPAPVRGAMQWMDGQTLLWRVLQPPPRLDFLLGEAHDQDGLPLPGGLTSLRVGEPPSLVALDLATGRETPVAPLPPDIATATLTPDRATLNLTVWRPGATRWDWQTVDYNVPLDAPALKSGMIAGLQPRLPADLESWVLSPTGKLVAGLRPAGRDRDLVIADVGGARQQVIPGFVTRAGAGGTAGVVWSADGAQVAALTYAGATSDLVTLDIATRTKLTAAQGLPVPAGLTRLAWSADGWFLSAGTVLVDLHTGTHTKLTAGDTAPGAARGAWAPDGPYLLFSAADWGALTLHNAATGEMKPLGTGLLVDWAGPGRVYLIRWPAAATRYIPPGQ